MTKFTCELTKPSNTIIFYNSEKQVGLLDLNGPVMTFEGDVDESAKVFFDLIADRFARRMSEKREWVGLTEAEMLHIDPDGYNEGFPQMIEANLKEKNTC